MKTSNDDVDLLLTVSVTNVLPSPLAVKPCRHRFQTSHPIYTTTQPRNFSYQNGAAAFLNLSVLGALKLWSIVDGGRERSNSDAF